LNKGDADAILVAGMATEVSPGTTFAGFRVESLAGRGAMAAVYRARDDEHEGVVALKLLDAADERFRERFLRESQLASGLEHPNVVRTLSAGEEDGRLYLAMEYIDGLDLRQLLRRDGRLEPERAVGIVEQAAAALDAAHKRGLVHRDVKPGNILIREDEDGDHAYVCDFGLARHVSSVSSLTGDRGFVGTIDYVSPEQIEGTPVEARADVYSLGCVLYECLTGVRPYDRDSELAVVFAHLNESPPKATDVRPELPAAFDDVFATALAKSRDERYSSCGELAAAARAALRGRVIARRNPRRRMIALAGAVAVAAGGVTAGILLTQSSTKPPTTVSATRIAGASLGASSVELEHLWGLGFRKASMQTPPNYSLLSNARRHVSAYFVGSTDRAVEITTWNSNDRTAEGIGPCSSISALKRAYGTRLRPSPNATHNGVVSAWLLGKHMIFATAPADNLVIAVGLYSDSVMAASFNVQNEAPCGPGPTTINTSPAPRVAAPPALTKTFASKGFTPPLTLRAPSGWSLRTSSSMAMVLASAGGTTLTITADPVAHPGNVSGTPTALATWLRNRKDLRVSAPATQFLSRPTLTWIHVDVSSRHDSASFFALGGGARIRSEAGKPMRLYLANVRVRRTTHTLLVAAAALSARALVVDAPAIQAIVGSFKVSAVSVPPLSALSSWCAVPFGGTCAGELTPGTHHSTTLRPKLTYTVPIGWTNETDHPGDVNLIPPHNDWQENSINNGTSDYLGVFTSVAVAKSWCGEGHGSIRGPAAFAAWLRKQPGMAVTPPRPVTLGGLRGFVVTIREALGWTKPCPWSHGQPAADTTVIAGVPPSPVGMLHGVGPRPAVMRLWLLGYHGGTLGIELDAIAERKLDEYSRVVRTFRFG
jgi:predicted Ser/Thr protein kinase